MTISAFAEMLSLGTLIPFLGAIAEPEFIFGQELVRNFVANFGVTTAAGVVAPLTILFVTAALFSGISRLFVLWATTKLTFAAGADLSRSIFDRTLHQPYSVHLSRNTSELVSGITNKNTALMFNIILPSLTILNSTLMTAFICTTLLFINPVVALAGGAGFILVYLVIAKSLHKHLVTNSHTIATEQTRSVQILQEGLGGIRDVLLESSQDYYSSAFKVSDSKLREAQGTNLFLSGSPRYIIESLGIGAVALVAFLLTKDNGLAVALPTLGVLALGVQRILPALQQLYNSWSLIMGNRATLTDCLELLEQETQPRIDKTLQQEILFNEEIVFDGIEFHYAGSEKPELQVPTLKIRKGARVGIVGKTGSGKSTFLDLLMGLLSPQIGSLTIDGITIDKNNRTAWQKHISHVPQSIYLTDGTIAENIAFGTPTDEIDMELVSVSARRAQLLDYVEQSPDGFNTAVGERGVRISGGQRQRIGLARAFYRRGSVLVLDEATSALDTETEQKVMNEIDSADHNITTFIVAHRTSTLENCEMTISIEKGRLCLK